MVGMRESTRAAAAAALLASTATASAVNFVQSFNEPRAAAAECSDTHIFLARGNNEPYPGRQGALVAAICDGVDSCDYEDLVYSNLYTNLYCQIVYDGAIAGHQQLAAYASRCPNSKLILSGYSNGGHVVTDILAGGGGTFYNGCVAPDLPALSRDNAPGNMIAAVIVAGNVRHTGSQSYDTGTGANMSGSFPRSDTMLSTLDGWADILRDHCVETDPICGDLTTKTGAVVADHLSYYDKFKSDFASWVQKKANLNTGGDFHTTIPTSISGTVQDYATIGTETPSGGVTQSPSWTDSTSVTAVTTTTASSSASASSSSPSSSSPVSSTKSSGSSSATDTSATITSAPGTSTPAGSSQGNASPTTTTTSAPNSAARLTGAAGALVGCGLAALAIAL